MRIGLFTETYLPVTNGVVTQIFNLKKQLEKKGHEVHIFCPSYNDYKDEEKNIHRFPVLFSTEIFEKMIGMKLDTQVTIPSVWKYRDIIKKLDILHAHDLFIMAYMTLYISKKYHIPYVITTHINYEEWESVFPTHKKFNKNVFGLLLRNLTDNAAGIISPSKQIKNQLSKRYHVEAPVVVIPNAVDIKKYKTIDKKEIMMLKKKNSLTKNNKILLFVGRLSKEKNTSFLLKAFSQICKEDPAVKLIVVGDGIYLKKLEKYTIKEGIRQNVIFTGSIPNAEIQKYYHLVDIFATASVSECLPVTLIESLASSLPIVAIDSLGTREVVSDGKNGILSKNDILSFTKAIKKLLYNPILRKEMGKNAFESAKKFSIETFEKQHEELYSKIISFTS